MNPCTLSPVPSLRLPAPTESLATWVAMALPVLLALASVGLRVRFRLPTSGLIAGLVSAVALEMYVTLFLGLASSLQRRVNLWEGAERARLASHGCSLSALNTQYCAAQATALNLMSIGTGCLFASIAITFGYALIQARRASRGQAGALSAQDAPT